MDSYTTLIEAFESLNERKRRDPDGLSKLEKARWRTMRCQIEEALFQRPRDPAADSREFLRVPVSLRVRFHVSGELREHFISVLGEGGLFVGTEDPCPLGYLLDLEVVPVGRGLSFRVKGEVVWARQEGGPDEQGMGVRFVNLTEQQKQMVYTLVDDTVRQGLLERRHFARIDTRLSVQMELGLKTRELQTHDLSLGGMFIACSHPVQVGDKHWIEVKIPGEFPAVKGLSDTIHKSTKPSPLEQTGFGIRFVDFGVEEQAAIRNYMSRRVCGEIRHAADEPRKHARLKRRIKLRFQAVNSFGTTDARDISGGGVFMQSREPPPLNSRIELTLIHPVTLHTLTLAGKVVRVVLTDPSVLGQVPGVGIEFEEMGAVKQKLFKEFLYDLVMLQSEGDKVRSKKRN